MKILVVGDFHGKFPVKLSKIAKTCDFVLSTGDFGGSDNLLKIVFKYFYGEWWEIVGPKKAKKYIMEDYNSGKNIINKLNNLRVPVYTIHGNWDFEDSEVNKRTAGIKLKKYSEIIKNKKNVNFLKRKIIDVGGLKLYAFGGSVTASIYLNHKKFDKKKET